LQSKAKAAAYLILQAESVSPSTPCSPGYSCSRHSRSLDGLITFAERRLLVWRPVQGETEPL
jgi:hypothetical protein